MEKDFNKKKQSTSKTKTKKICFLITPIGQEDSQIRKRVDQWKEIIYQAALGSEYKLIRADEIPSPGLITEQIVQYIVDADLVMIDYTGLNHNVMYEAAIRHLIQKPYIQIHEIGTSLPFDIHNLRSIPYDPNDLKYPEKLVRTIKKILKEIIKADYKPVQIIKEKFDLNKIVSDPVEFVKILKQYIVLPQENENKESGSIVRISDPYTSLFGTMRKKIVCPKCGVFIYEDPFSATSTSVVLLYNNYHYKCTNCGTEFDVT